MRNVLFIARHDLRSALRERETIVWVFLMPVVFFYFIGTVTGGSGFGGGGGAQKEQLELVAGAEAGFLADELARQLEDNDYEVTRRTPEEAGPAGEETARIALPARFTERVLAGEETAARLHQVSEGLGADYASFRVSRAVYTLLAALVATSEAGEEPGPQSFARLRDMPRALSVERRSAGKRKRIPHGFEQAVPGTLVMFTMIALLTTGAVSLVIERRDGLLRRLASAPIRRGEVVAGKWAGFLALGLVQVGWGMVLGRVLFGVGWGPDLGAVILLLVVWAGLVAALAILLGSLARTEGQAIGIAVISANVLAALGGCWWPIEITPAWMQQLALLLPTGWAMDGIHQLVVFENGAASALPHLVAMVLAGLVCWAVAARCFRYH